MQPCLPGPLKPCLPNPRRRIQEKQAAKRLADLNMQNVETQAYDAEAAMQVWGDKLAGASMAVDETLEAPCGADVGQPEEPIAETQVVLTPPRKKLPQPPSPLAPSPCCLALSKQGSLNLDPLQDSQMPLEAPTNSPAAEQPDSTFAAEKEGPAPDQPDRTFAAEKEAAAPDLPDLSGMAAVPHQSPEKPSLTHAPKRANPHPDEANTRVVEDDLSTSTAKVGEASVESSNLLQVAQAANLALQAAMQALSLEPDQGAPCPMRVEQFEMRDEGKPPRGRGRGKGRGKGTGRGKGGKGRGRGAAKNMVRPEGPENDEPIDVELWGEPVAENVPSEPEAEPQQTAKAAPAKAAPKAKGKAKAKAKGKAKARAKASAVEGQVAASQAQPTQDGDDGEEPIFSGGVGRAVVAKFFGLQASQLEPGNCDPPRKPGRAKRSGPTATFARRVKPKTNPAEARFEAIRDVFREVVAQKLEEMGQGKCAYEDSLLGSWFAFGMVLYRPCLKVVLISCGVQEPWWKACMKAFSDAKCEQGDFVPVARDLVSNFILAVQKGLTCEK